MLNVASNRQTATVQVEHAGQPKTMSFDGIVICAGVHGRGQAAAPEVSLLDDETKLVTSRLGDDRFRVAGTAEFNGITTSAPTASSRWSTGSTNASRALTPVGWSLGRACAP